MSRHHAGKPMNVGKELKSIIIVAQKKGRIKCKDAWALADENGVRKLDVARACEAMGIRISQCQLGAF